MGTNIEDRIKELITLYNDKIAVEQEILDHRKSIGLKYGTPTPQIRAFESHIWYLEQILKGGSF